MIYVVSGCLEASTIWYSVSKEKTSMSNLGEEWLIVLFTHLGKLHCKQWPWQHPYSGHMAKATIRLFLKTSEARLRAWMRWSYLGEPLLLLEGFLVEMLLSREALQLQLLKQVRSVLGCTEKPTAESGLFPLCAFWVIRWSDTDLQNRKVW